MVVRLDKILTLTSTERWLITLISFFNRLRVLRGVGCNLLARGRVERKGALALSFGGYLLIKFLRTFHIFFFYLKPQGMGGDV